MWFVPPWAPAPIAYPLSTVSRTIPSSIGRYQVLERLLSARYDDVYKAFDPMIERHLVVKTFSLEGVDPAAVEGIRAVFFGEMPRIGLLTHPGITTLFDAGELPRGLFLATEFVEGISLADHLATGLPLGSAERMSLVVQLADALEYAHEQGVPHLHLKPSSVIVGADFIPKIRGFGVAGVEDVLEAAGHRPDADELSERAVFAAPERVAGRRGDVRSDVYSIGSLAGRMLGGMDIDPAQRDAAQAAIDRARAASPDDRFDSVRAFKYTLLLALGVDETLVRAAFDATREASSVLAADASTLADLAHTAVNGDLTAMVEVTRLSPSGAEEMATRLAEPAPAGGQTVTQSQPAQTGDDPRKPS